MSGNRLNRRKLRTIIKEAVSLEPGSSEPTVFRSDLDPSVNVVVVYPEDSRYSQVAPIFDQKGHAFLLNDEIMVVDGAALGEEWFSDDHLTVIQAHELGHKRAGHGHTQDSGSDIEKEADWIGYNILKNRGHKAAGLHEEEYHARYNTHPSDDDDLMSHLSGFTD